MLDDDEDQVIIVEDDSPREQNNKQKSKKQQEKQQSNMDRILNANNPLIQQITICEQAVQQRVHIDQFITRFSKDQNSALQYLIENQVIENTNEDKAKVLMNTKGLNKDAINKYFCKPDQKNQEIFEAYCHLMNLKGKSYLDSMRLLLSRFRLAGEAQMVDRVVKIFARVYHQQNPNEFKSDETPYVLAYSFIMLSTDAASTKILEKNKMTKEQFLKNNIPVFPDIPPKYFEEVYDSITREPFQTTLDYLEQMYNRMILCNEKLQGEQITKWLQVAFDLMKGCNLVKYGRYNGGQPRKFFLSSDEKRICWRSIDNDNEPARYINMCDVHDIALGHNTTEIMIKNKIPPEFDISVDIKVNDLEIKSKWINYLRAVIINRREVEAKRAEEKQRRQENEEKRSEIWRNDILPFWRSHWDYEPNKPLSYKQYISVKKEEAVQKAQNQANSSSVLESLCRCLKKTISLNPIQNRQQIQNQHYSNQSEVNNGSNIQQEMIVQGKKNKSMLLMILWKLGLPDFTRRTLWPIIIGNNLKIREELYAYYVKDSKIIQESIRGDIERAKQQYPFITDVKAKELSNILHAFSNYRPDFGYIPDLIDIAVVLIKHLQEYDCFQALVNLLHQYHFLSVFQNDIRQIEWRLRFFEENLQRILPFVHNHLKAIKLETKLYLMKWFLKIFLHQFKFPMLSRLWDNFLLEGEIYLFKVGICYLKYFQIELKMSNLDEVVRILTNWQPEVNEDYFFIQIDEIPIKDDDYTKFLEQQNAAVLNTQIHQTLIDS
ncbi:unnamed protein product (macronuclear) [Paramecium tetraurelia]|uniref:Chromosome undetermined scaffold_27, whole genome shotgun sequence n=1 Tax=Paramecium tetraurelia TaxID=5888 RepID=Q5CZG9_PARTE|nr:uncharacterized protein GSPATT00010334001 [Paramecium tetraurelia]CAG38371.1 TBS1 [Paramecium tetraurelia]CAK74100.1 unnamed protein product [Paramecium tetraurelia]|eukprot:XP_001441497.1 hypothetical protein (macronuclear) [Paramecium tetraurelia strain d4-2]